MKLTPALEWTVAGFNQMPIAATNPEINPHDPLGSTTTMRRGSAPQPQKPEKQAIDRYVPFVNDGRSDGQVL